MFRRSVLAAPPAPLLAPAVLAAACQPRPAADARPGPLPVVFFADDSAAMGPDARAVVSGAADAARARLGAPVAVRGFSAPDGVSSPAFGRALAEARAQNVADAPVAGGVARDRVRVQPRPPVPFEMMPVESRRVEIHVGG